MILSDLIEFTSAINNKRISVAATEIAAVFEDALKTEDNDISITSITLKNGIFYQVKETYDEVLKVQNEKFLELVKGVR